VHNEEFCIFPLYHRISKMIKPRGLDLLGRWLGWEELGTAHLDFRQGDGRIGLRWNMGEMGFESVKGMGLCRCREGVVSNGVTVINAAEGAGFTDALLCKCKVDIRDSLYWHVWSLIWCLHSSAGEYCSLLADCNFYLYVVLDLHV